MAFYGKNFGIEKEENFDVFIQNLPIPEERKKKILLFKPTQKIEKDGDDYTFTMGTSLGDKVYKFKSGVEFDDTLNERKVKITATVDGNHVKQLIKFEDGSFFTVTKDYNDDTFTEEITHPKWDGVARRFYKAL